LTRAENDRVDDHLGALAAVFGISNPERVDRLVNQDPQAGVGRLIFVDDDPPGPLVAPTARLSGIDSNETVNPTEAVNACIAASR
jgi:hypothetical protein